MKLTFRETPTFTNKMLELLSEDSYFELQDALLACPDIGDLIQGGDGLRKLRWAAKGRGKRGGVRVIYYWQVSRDRILFLDIYAKNEKTDLTKDELQQLVKIKCKEFGDE